MKILFIGGDKRSLIAMKILRENGYDVNSYALENDQAVDFGKYGVFVLPVPTTRDNVTLNCPLSNLTVTLEEIKKHIGAKKVLSCGYGFDGCKNTDYMNDDAYCIRNAIPTAEGAISAAIDRTDFTLWKSKVLVIGAGRVSKVLCKRLKGFDCDLTVSARKESDFALLDAAGIKHIKTSSVIEKAAEFDIIFNTVDVNIFGSDTKPFEKTFLFDLSSKGCFDKDLSFENKKIYKLPALPSKCAVVTAGEILAQTIMHFIGN